RWRVLAMFVSLVAATGAALAPAPLAKLAIDGGIRHHDVGKLDLIVAAFLLSALLYAAASYAQTYLVGWVGQRALQDLRVRLFSHLQSLSISFYSRNRAGVIISRLTNDVEALDQLVEDGMATLFQSSLTLIGVVVILIVLDPHLPWLASFPAVELLSALVTVEILVIGGIEVLNGHASTGVVFAFIAALNNFFDPIQQLSQLYTTYQSGMAALDKIFELLDEPPELNDAPGALELGRIRGELRFDAVSFRYGGDEDDAWALRDIDLNIPAAHTVALVGETGAVKST